MTINPREAARRDWVQTGSFCPARFQGEQRRQYSDEAAKIQRQWDNQPR